MYRWNPFTNNLDEKGDYLFNGNIFGAKKTIGSTDNQDFGIITNNTEKITVSKAGNVGIGTTNPTNKLELQGTTSASAMRSMIGYDIYRVPVPTAPTAVVSASGSVDTGTHDYVVIYTTALGQTGNGAWLTNVTTTAGNNTVTLTIPVSTDQRVTGRKIYRTKAGVSGPSAATEYLLATIADNTTTTYVDTTADSSLSGVQGLAYKSINTTSNYITIDGNRSMVLDKMLTVFGQQAGASVTTGGDNALYGYLAGNAITSANANTYVGTIAGRTNIISGNNTGVGYGALYLGTGGGNTALGTVTLDKLKTGEYNIGIGYQAGRFLADGSTVAESMNYSMYLGVLTKASATNANNEIVIGYNNIGIGSNTVVLGNSSIVTTALRGNVGIGTTSPTAVLHLKAGTATAGTAPLKFTSGTLLTSPEAGAMEFLTDKFYLTKTTSTTRKEIKLVDQYYAEMYEYENTNATTIGTQNVYHAVDDFIAGSLSGFTFVSGLEGSGNITDYSGTVAGTVLLTDTAHGLLTGDIVTIHNSTDYNGTYTITKVSNDAFYFTKTHVSNQSADWSMGSYLLVSSGSDGVYKASFSLTAWAGTANQLFKFELNKGTTALDNTAVSRVFSTANDYGSLSTSGLVSIVAGDRIWLSTKNQTSIADITIRHANLNLIRL